MTYEERKLQNEKLRNFAYYILIAIISIASTTFLPMIGTEMGLGIQFPNTVSGWIIWITARLGVAVVNVMLFYCFIQQAKINVKDDPAYIEANELLKKYQKSYELKPRSPKRYFGKVWTSKGITLALGSLISTMVLTEAIMKFDLMIFLVYAFTVIMGVAFGYIEMRKTEEYWVDEFPIWVKETIKPLIEEEKIEIEKEEINGQDSIIELTGTSL